MNISHINVSKIAKSILPLGLLFGLLYLQWPMLKGSYYRLTDNSDQTISVQGSEIAWVTDLEQARLLSTQTGKPLLLDFTASWCPPCQVMKHEVWPDPKVAELVEENYIPVLLDVDDLTNRPIAQKYGVSSIPSIFVTSADGQILRRAASMSASQMVKFLTPKGSADTIL